MEQEVRSFKVLENIKNPTEVKNIITEMNTVGEINRLIQRNGLVSWKTVVEITDAKEKK